MPFNVSVGTYTNMGGNSPLNPLSHTRREVIAGDDADEVIAEAKRRFPAFPEQIFGHKHALVNGQPETFSFDCGTNSSSYFLARQLVCGASMKIHDHQTGKDVYVLGYMDSRLYGPHLGLGVGLLAAGAVWGLTSGSALGKIFAGLTVVASGFMFAKSNFEIITTEHRKLQSVLKGEMIDYGSRWKPRSN